MGGIIGANCISLARRIGLGGINLKLSEALILCKMQALFFFHRSRVFLYGDEVHTLGSIHDT